MDVREDVADKSDGAGVYGKDVGDAYFRAAGKSTRLTLGFDTTNAEMSELEDELKDRPTARAGRARAKQRQTTM